MAPGVGHEHIDSELNLLLDRSPRTFFCFSSILQPSSATLFPIYFSFPFIK
ncbi:hypothetical protein KL86SPO_50355 [uncultured Sporomusa sp.]|uniref:Uncharacterized protein n=1 Tax=uncultured Sporomusa sp. TaxID=307249 RepID=A0A212LYB8_9FIRM|nr:hypothetical protein KL86SPO_50355 [uncultured Sporomusa sp.]